MLPDNRIPLCVDCDGTLIRTDLLHEGLLLLVKQAPLSLLMLPLWLCRGKAYVKQRIAERVRFTWATLPFSKRVLELMAAARAAGRPVVLATASPRVWADAIAAQVGGFDRVVATEGTLNLGGAAKAQRLCELYGARGYDYIGNGSGDLAVWARARAGIVVSSRQGLLTRARAVTEVEEVVRGERAGPMAYLRMLRLHQWLKNLLVWVPLLAAHRVGSTTSVVSVASAFLAFGFCASAVYMMNDLLDLDADREHVRKRNRALASGLIPGSHAALLAPLLLLASLLLARTVSVDFVGVLATYFVMTLAYSLRLKRQVIVDVLLLAALYTIRIVGGAVAVPVTPSFWLLALSMFVFLSLAIVKRYSELRLTLAQSKSSAAGRGYAVTDLPVLLAVGVSSGMAAVLVVALYINEPQTRTLYPHTQWLWLLPPLVLYWISRFWMKAHRGEIDDDPVVFAIRDWQSLLTVALSGGCFAMAALPAASR